MSLEHNKADIRYVTFVNGYYTIPTSDAEQIAYDGILENWSKATEDNCTL